MLRITHLKSKYVPLSKLASGRWKIHFGFEPYYEVDEEGNKTETQLGTWTETLVPFKPSLEQLKKLILDAINKRWTKRFSQASSGRTCPYGSPPRTSSTTRRHTT